MVREGGGRVEEWEETLCLLAHGEEEEMTSA